MRKEIDIAYYSDSHKEKLVHYNYQMTLNDNANSQLDYFTGKQRLVQMDALAYALTDALPENAVIESINQVPYPSTKQDVLQMLDRKDDYLATILFEQDEQTDKQTITPEKNTATDQAATNTTNENTNTTNEPKDPDQVAANAANAANAVVKPTAPINNSLVAHLIAYQPQGKHSYHEINLDEQEPADQDKVRKIGRSLLMYPFFYADLKALLHDDTKAQIFTEPIGIVPENGQLTAMRKQNIATNAGLTQDALLKSNFVKIATLKNTNNNHTYNLYCVSDTNDLTEPNKTVKAPATTSKTNTNNSDALAMPQNKPETATDQAILTAIKQINDNLQTLSQTLTDNSLANNKQHTNFDHDLQTMLDYQKALKTNQDEKYDQLVALWQKGLPESPQPTAKDLAGLPAEIVAERKANPQAKAIYLFELINKISQTDVPAEYEALLKPEMFLKAVHLLSWPN